MLYDEYATWEYDFIVHEIFQNKYKVTKYNKNTIISNIAKYKEFEGCIMVLSRNNFSCDNMKILMDLIKPKALFWLSDEHGITKYSEPCIKSIPKSTILFHGYNHSSKHDPNYHIPRPQDEIYINESGSKYTVQYGYEYPENSMQIPLGYVVNYINQNIAGETKKISERKYNFGFVGQIVKKQERREMLLQFLKLSGVGGRECVINSLEPFQRSSLNLPENMNPWRVEKLQIQPRELYLLYEDCIFVPIGRGYISLDCFRIYEAVVAGAIPVIVGSESEINRTVDYNGNKPPFLFFRSWPEAAEKCLEMLNNIENLQKRQRNLFIWWKDIMDKIRQKILQTGGDTLPIYKEESLAKMYESATETPSLIRIQAAGLQQFEIKILRTKFSAVKRGDFYELNLAADPRTVKKVAQYVEIYRNYILDDMNTIIKPQKVKSLHIKESPDPPELISPLITELMNKTSILRENIVCFDNYLQPIAPGDFKIAHELNHMIFLYYCLKNYVPPKNKDTLELFHNAYAPATLKKHVIGLQKTQPIYENYMLNKFGVKLKIHYVLEGHGKFKYATQKVIVSDSFSGKVDIAILNLKHIADSSKKINSLHLNTINLLQQIEFASKILYPGGTLILHSYILVNNGQLQVLEILNSLFQQVEIRHSPSFMTSVVILIVCSDFKGRDFKSPKTNGFIWELYRKSANPEPLNKLYKNIIEFQKKFINYKPICNHEYKFYEFISIYYRIGKELFYPKFMHDIRGGSKMEKKYQLLKM